MLKGNLKRQQQIQKFLTLLAWEMLNFKVIW